MMRKIATFGAWFLGGALAVAGPSSATSEAPRAGGQEQEEEAPDTTPQLEAAVTSLGAAYDEEDDAGAAAALDEVLANYAHADEKIQKSALKEVAVAFGRKIRSEEIGVAAARALGKVGMDASELLGRAMGDRSLAKDRPRVREEVIRVLGGLADERQARNLVKLLQDKEFSIVATAAEALGGYERSPEKIRKEAFKAVHDVYQSTFSQTRDPRNTTYRQKWDIIKADCEGTMRKLSGQTDLTAPLEWQNWYNKNKKAPWPDADEGS